MTRFGIEMHIRPLTLTINGLYETWYIQHINNFTAVVFFRRRHLRAAPSSVIPASVRLAP